jgi:peptidoglycan/LPS O-acetylase OafA/YrhL
MPQVLHPDTPPLTAPPPRRGLPSYIPALDGLRGIAILLVLLFHMDQVRGTNLLDRIVFGAFSHGWVGVDLFFVLSGFLITGILLDAKDTPLYFRNFYARRALRIFPLYYAVITLYLVILPRFAPNFSAHYGHHAPHPILFWLYLSNHAFLHGSGGVLNPTWSLGVEEQFYLVFPLIVFLLSRRALMRLCPVLIALALAIRCTLLARHMPLFYLGLPTPCRVDSLAVGALIACAARDPRGLRMLTPWLKPIAIAAAIGLIAITSFQRRLGYEQGELRWAIGLGFIAILAGCLLLLALTTPPTSLLHRLLTRRWLMAFGKYSYALYLLHAPILEIILGKVYPLHRFLAIGNSQLPGQIIFAAICFPTFFAAAFLSWHLFEKHFLTLKRFVPMGNAATARPQRQAGVDRADMTTAVGGPALAGASTP